MIRKYYSLLFLLLLLHVGFISCKADLNKKLILGTWMPIHPAAIHSSELTIKFLPNQISIVSMNGQPPKPGDTLSYELNNNNQTLIIKEKTGKIETFEILSLSVKELMLLSKKNGDTLQFIKD